MSNVFLFGAGASCEYQGVWGTLFIDSTFFPAIEEMWAHWLRGGAPVRPFPDLPGRPELPSEPAHYDGGRWRWPNLEAMIECACGPNFRQQGLEATFSQVAAAGEAQADLYIRGIELTLFHRIRALKATNVGVHLRFLSRHLRSGDALLTFNYDPLIETALQFLPPEQGVTWHPANGYGLELRDLGADSDAPTGLSTVELLKLHGSMNWLAPTGTPPRPPFRLLRITQNSLRGPGRLIHVDEHATVVRPVILPPQPKKDYEAVGLGPLWRRAEEVLAAASSLTVIGYRLPAADQDALDLLQRSAVAMRGGTRVTYVTRDDEDAIQRFLAVFPRAEIHRDGFRAYTEQIAAD